MAIPVINFSMVKRSEGRSSVGGAAYLAGCYIRDILTDIVHNHSYKWDVKHSEISAPNESPDWVFKRNVLWNKVEVSERWKTAQVAREGYAALPRELTNAQNIELARDFIKSTFVDKGMIVDWAFHDTAASDGGRNPHLHFQMTVREIDTKTGEFRKAKNRLWNDQSNVDMWRDAFEKHVNAALRHAGFDAQIDMRSYEEQGVDVIAQVHMGKEATALEDQGIHTIKGDHNRQARMLNFMKKQAKHAVEIIVDLPVHTFEYVRKWFGVERKRSSHDDDILQHQNAQQNPEQGR
jgi:ATP-dependent exoDNAse (exonuclease V) alpha subunit